MDVCDRGSPASGPRVSIVISWLSSSSSYILGFARLFPAPDPGGKVFPLLGDLPVQFWVDIDDLSLPRPAIAFGAVGTEKTRIPHVVSATAQRPTVEKLYEMSAEKE